MKFSGDLQGFEMLLALVGLLVLIRLLRGYKSSPAADVENEDWEPPKHRRAPLSLSFISTLTDFSIDEIRQLYRAFKNDCPCGTMDEDTFIVVYSQFFREGDATAYGHYLFTAFDQRQEGVLSFEDFIINISTLLRGKAEDKLKWLFRLYDINKDGFITRDEIFEIVRSIHLMADDKFDDLLSENSRNHAEKVFNKINLDSSGFVTYPQFLAACKNDNGLIQSMDIFKDSKFGQTE